MITLCLYKCLLLNITNRKYIIDLDNVHLCLRSYHWSFFFFFYLFFRLFPITGKTITRYKKLLFNAPIYSNMVLLQFAWRFGTGKFFYESKINFTDWNKKNAHIIVKPKRHSSLRCELKKINFTRTYVCPCKINRLENYWSDFYAFFFKMFFVAQTWFIAIEIQFLLNTIT